MELVDIQDLKSWGSNAVPVQFRPRVQFPIIDSHCHLDLVVERGVPVPEITTTLEQNGVTTIVEIGADKNAMQWARTLAHTSKKFDVFYTIGHHPGEATTEDSSFGLAFVEENQHDEKFVAVGEIGLDYHYYQDTAAQQKGVFEKFLEAAVKVQRPVCIHTRDAHKDTVEILHNYADKLRVLIHCFTGSNDEMKEFLQMGFYVSFSGIVTFKNAKELQLAASECPLERILVETDAPFLAPVPHRGKQNQPGWVRDTLKFIANLRGESEEILAAATYKNTCEFYGLNLP